MSKNCVYCNKPIRSNTFVRLNDAEDSDKVHVKCFLKKMFPDAKPGEIKTKRISIVPKPTEAKE